VIYIKKGPEVILEGTRVVNGINLERTNGLRKAADTQGGGCRDRLCAAAKRGRVTAQHSIAQHNTSRFPQPRRCKSTQAYHKAERIHLQQCPLEYQYRSSSQRLVG